VGDRGHRWTPPQLSLLGSEAALKAERLQLCVVIHGPGLIEDLALAVLDLIPKAGVEVHRVVWLNWNQYRVERGPRRPPVDSSEIVHQGVGDDVGSACQVIPNDQAQHLSTLGGLVEHPNVTVGGVGVVAVNDGDGEGGRFGRGHVVWLNWNQFTGSGGRGDR